MVLFLRKSVARPDKVYLWWKKNRWSPGIRYIIWDLRRIMHFRIPPCQKGHLLRCTPVSRIYHNPYRFWSLVQNNTQLQALMPYQQWSIYHVSVSKRFIKSCYWRNQNSYHKGNNVSFEVWLIIYCPVGIKTNKLIIYKVLHWVLKVVSVNESADINLLDGLLSYPLIEIIIACASHIWSVSLTSFFVCASIELQGDKYVDRCNPVPLES